MLHLLILKVPKMSNKSKLMTKQDKALHVALRKARKTGSQLNASMSRKQWVALKDS